MKNIQVIDGAVNCAYEIFAATDEQFDLIFSQGTDIAFVDEVLKRGSKNSLEKAFAEMWGRKVDKKSVMGIHGMLFYELDEKKPYYPGRLESEALY